MHDILETLNKTALKSQGRSFGSFGEIIQGRKSNGEDFLITIPVDLWSVCTINLTEYEGALRIKSEYVKSKKVAEIILARLGISYGYKLDITFQRNIPIGKGLSSSTADMLATVKALQKQFDFTLPVHLISDIFKEIEPHDGIMYESSVAYNHRNGELLTDFKYTPDFHIVAIDFGGDVDSIKYNKCLNFTRELQNQYDQLFDDCGTAFKQKDDKLIAHCATRSLALSLELRPDPFRKAILQSITEFGALGAINTHSGTCVGLIYPSNTSQEMLQKTLMKVEKKFRLPVFLTRSLGR